MSKRNHYVVLKDGKHVIFLDDPYEQFTHSRAHAERNAKRMGNWYPKFKYTVHTATFSKPLRGK